MGKYINYIEGQSLKTSSDEKCNVILEQGGVELDKAPVNWEEDLVCVIDNHVFAAAAYCFDQGELNEFRYSIGDIRPRRWFKLKNAKNYID